MVTKLGQFTKLGHFSFLNCPNFVTIFCCVLKRKIIFFQSPQLFPAHRRPEFIDQSILSKKIMFLYIFKEKEKNTSFSGNLLYISVLHFLLLLKIYRKVNFFGKIDWSMNSGRPQAGDSQGYNTKYFNFENATENGNKVWTI